MANQLKIPHIKMFYVICIAYVNVGVCVCVFICASHLTQTTAIVGRILINGIVLIVVIHNDSIFGVDFF